MDVSNGATQSLAAPLADGTGALGIALPFIAVALLILLIGGFWLGKRKKDAELPPPRPEEQPSKPRERTHIDESEPHSPDRFPEDGRPLTPYELNDHGNEPLPPDTDPPRS